MFGTKEAPAGYTVGANGEYKSIDIVVETPAARAVISVDEGGRVSTSTTALGPSSANDQVTVKIDAK